MGRTKGSLGKKTLAKMGKLSAKGNDMFATVAEITATTPEIGPEMDVEGYTISPDTEETRARCVKAVEEHLKDIKEGEDIAINTPKKRGRKPGSKNKKTKQEDKEKSNFTSLNVVDGEKKSGEEINCLETYYRIAVEDKAKLEKKLEKETNTVAISFIKASIMCNRINIKRHKMSMGGVLAVVGEDEEMSGDDVRE